ncbi:hypothetical protein CVT24_012853 [Panaeolus cyanescens]|uniref:Uncharacterized protein n=1 Tax=Panaeolus cyanescens TaxID=181874 RepID=A0A409WWU5_9AGAR|nr:hypothetical protein CVT24_012853 [Panaeolus cyanescens]
MLHGFSCYYGRKTRIFMLSEWGAAIVQMDRCETSLPKPLSCGWSPQKREKRKTHSRLPQQPLGGVEDCHQAEQGARFFSKAHRATNAAPYAPSVLDAASTNMGSATNPNCGMEKPSHSQDATIRESSSHQTENHYVSNGSCQKDAPVPSTTRTIGVQDVGTGTTALKDAILQRRHKACTTYRWEEWERELDRWELRKKYKDLVAGMRWGFHLGISVVDRTHTPPNHLSVKQFPEAYQQTVEKEFKATRYLGPLSREEVEAVIGPFQSSPLSLIPKPGKQGKFRAIHNFSYPHTTKENISSVNSKICADDFPCTWGTFSTVFLLVARLPQG